MCLIPNFRCIHAFGTVPLNSPMLILTLKFVLYTTGDSYRFTLQPVFADMERSYRCHLRRRVPDLLYQLWFYVSVPNVEQPFETPRQHVNVRPLGPATSTSVRSNDRDDDAKNGRKMSSTSVASSLVSGRTTVEFLQVEFDAAIDLPSEIIVAGRKSHDGGSGSKWSYVVESQRRRLPINAQHPVEGIDNKAIKQSETVHVAAVDFEQPFGYSTSTWLNGMYADYIWMYRLSLLYFTRSGVVYSEFFLV